MPNHYLLIGAGFSRNWGGWLASEAFEFLIGDPAVVQDTELRALLWKHQARGGFEAVLDELQGGGTERSLQLALKLRSAVVRMFGAMNSTFRSNSLEFRETFANDVPVRDFLLRFKAIFSLNQDLLLERCYRGSKDGLVDRTNVQTERDWQFPGMRLMTAPNEQMLFPSALHLWVPSGVNVIPEGEQPIFKLHGSSNWRSAEASDMMIIGGGKARAIEQFPVLQWYSQVFVDVLSRPDTRLMIIGYGFRDDHINAVLTRAVENGLKIYVIDQLGAEAASQSNSLTKGSVGYRPTAIEEAIQKALIGASRRPLSSTFATDDVERRKIERFFDT